MSTMTLDAETWIGTTLVDANDSKLGTIEAIYFDEQTGLAQWMAVKTGLLGTTHNFVPLADAMPIGNAIKTPYAKSQIQDAPKVDPDEDLRDDQVLELYGYYGLPYDAPVDHDHDHEVVVERDLGLTATDPGTRAEEDMRIATGQTVSDRVA